MRLIGADSRLKVFCGLVVLLLLVGGLLYWWLWSRRQGIGYQALSVARSSLDGDFDKVMAHEPEGAKILQGVTKDKLKKVHDRLIKPFMRGWTIEQEVFENQAEGVLGTATITLRHANGRRIEYGQNLWFTSDGPKEASLWHLLNFSWKLRFADRAGPKSVRHWWERKVRGLRADKEFLSSLGLTGSFDIRTGKLNTWDEVIARNERLLATEYPVEFAAPPAR